MKIFISFKYSFWQLIIFVFFKIRLNLVHSNKLLFFVKKFLKKLKNTVKFFLKNYTPYLVMNFATKT